MSSYGVVLATRSITVYFFFQLKCLSVLLKKFAWALLLNMSSLQTMSFSQKPQKRTGHEDSNCPHSAISSPHVKFAMGCQVNLRELHRRLTDRTNPPVINAPKSSLLIMRCLLSSEESQKPKSKLNNVLKRPTKKSSGEKKT